MSLTADRNTPARVPQMRTFVAGADIFGGAMVAINASGKAVPAADAAGLVVVGRAEYGAKAGENVSVKAGCFAYDAPTGVTVTVADIGKTVFVVDNRSERTLRVSLILDHRPFAAEEMPVVFLQAADRHAAGVDA